MDYKARFYSPYLNRFIQPDMILPDLNNSQYLNRYSYVINQPIVLNDPSGHCPTCLAGLLIGAAIGFTVYALASGDQFNVADAIIATGVGAVGGALIGTGAGLATGSLMIAGISATSASVAAGVASGAGTGLLASQAGYTVAARSNYNRDEMFVAAGTGLVSGVVSGYASAATSAGLITAGAATTARVGMGWIAGASQYSFTELVNGRRPDAGRAIAMGIWGSMLSGIDEIVGPIRVFKYDPSTAIIDDAIIATVRSSTIQYINNQAPNRNTNTGLLSLRME
jgi:hypothetical protein